MHAACIPLNDLISTPDILYFAPSVPVERKRTAPLQPDREAQLLTRLYTRHRQNLEQRKARKEASPYPYPTLQCRPSSELVTNIAQRFHLGVHSASMGLPTSIQPQHEHKA